jgi:hypothetical protein
MRPNMRKMANSLFDLMAEPDVLRTFRAVIQQYEPNIKIDENSMFTFVAGLIMGQIIGTIKPVGSKDLKELNKMIINKLPEMKSILIENFSKYEVHLKE